ncbi:MAG: glycoside hydrolase family 32 protein [Parafilimonas sp.]|nr:glycoside hydrolase family 32 protein [Parafilimonas sp.]
MKRNYLVVITILLFTYQQTIAQTYHEQYRPQIHFSPKAHWMNDPNGMVYYNGIYHLFFQYYPNASVWGPMHWGHAISPDLIHWKQQPIALYPDSIGYIFSGSVVVDKNNTSGLGMNGKPAVVAIFTQHDTAGEHAHTNTYQNQSIAYSNDEGKTWTKYNANPVLKNPGITDFRDPKVMWYDEGNKWIMTLAVKDHIAFYSSPDLKTWTEESQFGKDVGAHGGVWECPDLISFDDNGKKVWALIVNINPGGPNGGSATQYFLGDFDGKIFKPFTTDKKWIDYGPDEYAGVTYSNTDNRKIFLGWMSNWSYAQLVPTEVWRSAMTLPRNLNLMHVGDDMFIASKPVVELNSVAGKQQVINAIAVNPQFDLSQQISNLQLPCRLEFNAEAKSFSVNFSNDKNELLVIGYDEVQKHYYINRSQSGEVDFEKTFSEEHAAPRILNAKMIHLTIIADVSSVELFADDGLSVMTEIYFASKPFGQIQLKSDSGMQVNNFIYTPYKSIWK